MAAISKYRYFYSRVATKQMQYLLSSSENMTVTQQKLFLQPQVAQVLSALN